MNRRMTMVATLGIAIIFTTLQIGLALHSSSARGLSAKYQSLIQWDTRWYQNIVEYGYHSTIPPVRQDITRANVGFFPAYPLLSRVLARVPGLKSDMALLLTAQLACIGSWVYFLLLCRRWRLPTGYIAATAGVIIAFPSSYFLVSAYSESLFLMTLLGMLYWSGDTRRWSWLIAGMHGFVLSATRLVGLPLAIIPLILRPKRITSWRWIAATGLALGGGLAFFAYCQWQFGHWNLYFWTQEVGWRSHMDLWAFFRSSLYTSPAWPLAIGPVGHLGFRLGALAFVLAAATEVGCRTTGRRERLIMIICALGIFAISVCGSFSRKLTGMLRYDLPVITLLALCMAYAIAHRRYRSSWWPAVALIGTVAAIGLGLWLQVQLANFFTRPDYIGIA